MILLNGNSLAIRDRFRPESMALNLEERASTATLTLGPEAPEIRVNDWLRDDCEPGAGIVWRVKTIDSQYDKKTRTVTLEHVIGTLNDLVMFGEVKPGTMAGNSKASTCTARQAIQYILSRQADWKLGDVEVNPSNPYSFNGDTLFDAIETVTRSLADVQWEYDMSRYPFTLHIRKQPSGFQSEMRMSRNITTLRVTIDKNRMYTRHYPIGKNNLHIDGDFTSKNEGIWGTKCKVETDQSKGTKAELKAWSLERLNRHCEPLVTVTVTGLDLSRDTGESLDNIVIGRRCRLPLPDFNTSMNERVTKISWKDKIRYPKNFTVTMANLMEDVASIVNNIQKSGGGGGRAAAKNAEEDHAWFVDTTEKVGMVAEAVAGPGADKDWSRVSEVFADGVGLHGSVVKTQDDLVVAETRIEATENGLRTEVTDRKNAVNSMNSRIDQQANKIGLVVEEKNGQNVIRSASIVAGINSQSGSYVKIRASTIDLSGYVTASQLSAVSAKIDNLYSGNAVATQLRANSLRIISGYSFYYGGDVIHKRTVTIGEDDYRLLTW